MEVDIEVNGALDVVDDIDDVIDGADDDVDEAVKSFGEDLLEQFIQTSPVDTGYYRSNWEFEKPKDRVVKLVNRTDYAPYLTQPNSQMVGAEGADARGILHNVRGMAFSRKSEFRARVAKALYGGVD